MFPPGVERSAIQPNVMYPKKAPTCTSTIHFADFVSVKPAPPFSTGVARKLGSQEKSPQ